MSKFSRNKSGNCSLCGFFPGTVSHYLSGNCTPLSNQLQSTLNHSIDKIAVNPILLHPVLAALSLDVEDFVSFILDPGSHHLVVNIKQEFGQEFIWPLFKLSRAYIWCMHRERMKLIDS